MIDRWKFQGCGVGWGGGGRWGRSKAKVLQGMHKVKMEILEEEQDQTNVFWNNT